MTIRITFPDGLVVETDSVREATEVRNAFTGKRTRRLPLVKSPEANRSATSSSELSALPVRFLDLLSQHPAGINTDTVAKTLGIGPKSIPPILRALNRWAKHRSFDLKRLISGTAQFVDRRPVTFYRLTDEGRKAFGAIVQAHRNGAATRRDGAEEEKATA
jgi:DNA-binding PadR family transcriptional regulator